MHQPAFCFYVWFFASAASPASVTIVRQTKLYVEGVPVRYFDVGENAFPMIEYQDTNYIPAASVAAYLGKNLQWDEQAGALSFDGKVQDQTSFGTDDLKTFESTATVEVVHNFTAANDGAPLALKSPVLLYQNNSYIAVRSAADVLKMEVAAGKFGSVYLRTPLTEQQKADMDAYITVLTPLWTVIDLENTKLDTADIAYYRQELPKLQEALAAISVLQRPDVPLWKSYYHDLDVVVADINGRIEKIEAGLNEGKTIGALTRTYFFPYDAEGHYDDEPLWDWFLLSIHDMKKVFIQS